MVFYATVIQVFLLSAPGVILQLSTSSSRHWMVPTVRIPIVHSNKFIKTRILLKYPNICFGGRYGGMLCFIQQTLLDFLFARVFDSVNFGYNRLASHQLGQAVTDPLHRCPQAVGGDLKIPSSNIASVTMIQQLF